MSMDTLVFTFSGRAGAGKDVCAEMVKQYCDSIGKKTFKLAFGDAVKWHCMRNFGYVNKDTDRHILQEFGTHVRGIEQDYWALQVYNAIDAFSSMFNVFVISDARYDNELQLFPYKFAYPIINVYVKPHGDTSLGETEYNHESEDMGNNPDMSKFHYVIDNSGDLENTYIQIMQMVDDVIDKQEDFLAKQRGFDNSTLDDLLGGDVNE